MKQSRRDARPGEMPVVIHRRNREKWLVTMEFDDWMYIYRESGIDETTNTEGL